MPIINGNMFNLKPLALLNGVVASNLELGETWLNDWNEFKKYVLPVLEPVKVSYNITHQENLLI